MDEILNKNLTDEKLDLDVSDEIVVKDEQGNFRILIGGKLEDLPAGFKVVEKKAVQPTT